MRPDALRGQAAADGALLERLRTHGRVDDAARTAEPSPTGALDASASGPRPATPGESRWATVDDWRYAHGFDIAWHGARGLDAPPAQQDALVRAVAECLENTRRHSG